MMVVIFGWDGGIVEYSDGMGGGGFTKWHS